MWIPGLSRFVDEFTLKNQKLNGGTLVFDAQNYFYKLYQMSKLQFVFGCECDKYLAFLQQHLNMFKVAKIKCYFIFKGGHKYVGKRIEKGAECDGLFQIGEPYKEIVPPIFMYEIHRQVLNEMGFSYVICEYDAKTECIALAQKLKCPVVSYDIEFCLKGRIPYISYLTFKFNRYTQALTANVFELDRFLQQLRIDEDKLATFLVLMDENIFPANYFVETLKFLILPLLTTQTNLKFGRILKWLEATSTKLAMDCIFANLNSGDQDQFLKAKEAAKNMMCHQESCGVASEYLENGCRIEITKNDPMWFEKGVVSGMIAIAHVNLYRHSLVFGSHTIANSEAEEPLLLSSEIIKYAYNLLTNFQRESFVIKPPQGVQIIVETKGMPKPDYEAKESVFENGWEEIKSLGLFENFLNQTIPGFKDQCLDEVPEDAKLLMIALLYYKRYSTNELTDAVVGAVILSYVSLGVVGDTQSNDTNNNKGAVTETDKAEAKILLSKYNSVIDYQAACRIFDPTLIHPFVEFQHCLDSLGLLNKLCGAPYTPIVFSKMINGTFIYKVLFAMEHESKGDVFGFLNQLLCSAPTVLTFLKRLFKIYQETSVY